MEQIQRGEHKRKGLSFGIENSYSSPARQGEARQGKEFGGTINRHHNQWNKRKYNEQIIDAEI